MNDLQINVIQKIKALLQKQFQEILGLGKGELTSRQPQVL